MKKILFAFVFTVLLASSNAGSSTENHALRIISLTPATTEILFALGLDKEIIGVSTFCDYPKAALSKERVGTFSQANVEKILFLRPTIVFCTGLEQTPLVSEFKQLGLKVYVCDPSNLKELFTCIREMGALTGKEKEAAALVAAMQAGLHEINAKVNKVALNKRPKIFVEIWNVPLMSVGRTSFVDELITLAGGTNIAGDMPRPYSYFSSEQVLKRDPDIIFVTHMTRGEPLSLLKSRFGWDKITAVKNKRVYNDIDPDILLRPGPRLIEGLQEIAKRLYP
jgi:iron complex transport system substrate-binding protein